MAHVNILACFLMVTIGAAVAYQGLLTYRVYRFPAVRSFVLYIALYNVVYSFTFVGQYLARNVSSLSVDEKFVIIGIAMGSVAYTISGISAFMFAATISYLSGRQRMPTWFVFGYGFLCAAWLAGFAVGCYRYIELADRIFLWEAQWTITLSLVALDFLIPAFLLFNLRHIQSDRQRQIAGSLGMFFLLLSCLEIAALFIAPSLKILAFLMVGLALNIIVLAYLRRMTAAYYGAAPQGTELNLSLDWICTEFHLSSRERDIVQRILRGRSNKEIEQELFISPHTVKNHIYHIFQKTGMKSRGQLVSKVMEHSAEPDNGHMQRERLSSAG
jgi:DNA-binding CsgD family transcriptional regulator